MRDDLRASMGPRLFGRGNKTASVCVVQDRTLQWGHDFLVVETILSRQSNVFDYRCFNGATTFWSWKRDEAVIRFFLVVCFMDIRHLASGQVRVAATPGVGVYLLPDWVQAFRQTHPHLTVTVQTSITPHIVAGLRRGEMDLGFVEGELENLEQDDVAVLELEVNEQFVIVGPKHPWWERSSVRLADLAGRGMVMRQRNSQTRIWLDGELQRAGVQVQVVAEFDNVESIKRAVAKGKDIAILPEYAVRSELEMGLLRALPIEGKPLQRTLKLVWNRARPFSAVTRAFLRFLAQEMPALSVLLDERRISRFGKSTPGSDVLRR